MRTIFFSGLMLIAGTYFFIRNLIYLLNESKMRVYLENSPKAKFWIKKLGMERTVRLSRFVFLPLGTLVALFFILIGSWRLLLYYGIL